MAVLQELKCMATENIYSTPEAILEVQDQTREQYYEPKMMSFSGRIGRVRYLAYALGMYLLFGSALGGVAAIATLMPKSVANGLLLMLMSVAYIGLIVYFFSLAKRRLNDIDISGWFVLVGLIPIVNFVFGLVLLFWPGTPAVNRFGPMPSRNNSGVLLAAVLGFVMITGVLAAIAIPAYQDYTQRAQQARAVHQDR